MLRILFLVFFVYAGAIAHLDSISVVKPYVNSSRPLRNNFGRSRISRNLVKRQGCADSQSLVCQDQSCCPTGGACCSMDNVTVDGCCGQGFICSFIGTGPRCISSDGGGGTSSGDDSGCNDQGYVECTNYDACCPAGKDCYIDSTNNLRCSATSATLSKTSSISVPASTFIPSSSAPPPPPSSSASPPPPSSSSISPPPPSSSSASPPSPSSSSASIPSASMSPTLTTASQASTPSTAVPMLDALLDCSPCGPSTCAFSVDSSLSNVTYSLIVGTPVNNCEGSDSNVTDTTGGSITIDETWSTGATIGLDLGALKIEADGSWEHSTSREFDQSVGIEVEPGKWGVLIANITYKRTSGSIQVGNGQGFPVVSNQPIAVTSYGAEIVPCGEQFNANTLTPSNCTSNAHMWLRGKAPSMIYLLPMVVILILIV